MLFSLTSIMLNESHIIRRINSDGTICCSYINSHILLPNHVYACNITLVMSCLFERRYTTKSVTFVETVFKTEFSESIERCKTVLHEGLFVLCYIKSANNKQIDRNLSLSI